MDDNPRQFVDELKGVILRRRIGQIALAVVLAEECIRFLNALVWYLIIPTISNVLAGHTESVLFPRSRQFPWIQLVGAVLEFITTLIFVFYVNRWIRGQSRPRKFEPEPRGEQPDPIQQDDQPLVPRMLSAPYPSREEPVPSVTERSSH